MNGTSIGYASLELTRRVHGKTFKIDHQFSNTVVRAAVRDLTTAMWANARSPNMNVYFWPWRLPPQWDGGASGVPHRAIYIMGNSANFSGFPAGTDQSDSTSCINMGGTDMRRYRFYQNTPGSSLAANVPRAFGALILADNQNYIAATIDGSPGALVVTDIPLSSIGVAWLHPASGVTVTTVAGQSYVTGLDSYQWRHSGGVVRIESGPDRGVYLFRHTDRTNFRYCLSNMDGSIFVASGSGSYACYGSPRTAQMNEVSVVPNGKGTVSFDGQFDPGENRTSYLLRLRFEKSGSPSPSDASQKGSYWFGIRPWLHGTGRDGSNQYTRYDVPHMANSQIGFVMGGSSSGGIAYNTGAGHVGQMCSAVLDRTNQRLWMVTSDGSNGSLYWWRYKSPECYHETLTTTGTAGDPPTGAVNISSPAAFPRCVDIGSDNTVYVACYGNNANAGWVSITPDMVATQVKRGDVGLGSFLPVFVTVDRSRYRSGAANTITTTAGGGNLVAAGGAFTQADVGRAIKITSGADAGTYLISVVTDGTHITVTTLAGAGVTFAGQVASGSWQIGDRIYLGSAEATSCAGKLYYFESLAFGVLLSRTLTMTNGALTQAGISRWSQQMACVDQSTGVYYWCSTDTTVQVNRFDPSQASPNGWSRRLLTDFSKANDVSQNSSNATTATGMGDPTGIKCIGVNPHPSFRELWLGTDQGWIKLNPDSFATGFSRYWGNGSEATPYQRPAGYPRSDGSWGCLTNGATYSWRKMQWIGFGPDGRVMGAAAPDRSDSPSTYNEWVIYNRECDLWTTGVYENLQTNAQYAGLPNNNTTTDAGYFISPYGEIWLFSPSNKTYASGTWLQAMMCQMEIHYQYIGGVWTPKEAVKGSLPGTLSPGLSCKDLHTDLQDLIMGVKVQFTPQGGATPANTEFLGRLGCLGAARADGAWQSPAAGSAATQVFLGSGFASSNVGDYVNVTASTGNGASIGIYQITAYTNGNTVTVRKISNQNFAPGNDSGTLTYQLWSMGDATVPGPENATVILGHGVARDSSQDVTNINFHVFMAKTLLSEQQEGIKFCVDPPGPPGSPGLGVYLDVWPYNTSGYGPNSPGGTALPGAQLAKGLQLVDGAFKYTPCGVNGIVDARTDTSFNNGRCAYSSMNSGWALSLDFGLSVEIGSVIVRGSGGASVSGRGGIIGNLHNAPDGAAPAAASVIRTSGANGLTLTGGNITAANSLLLATRTATLSAGDFLGSSLATGTNGQTTAGGNRLAASAGNFQASHLMCAVKITTGSDIGTYRIINVAGDGSYIDVRNLDQTAKTFTASASGLSWDVRDAAREEDLLYSASAGKMTIERLLSPTTLEVRTCPHVSLSNAAWSVYKPTWNLVKRLSNSVSAAPPDVKNNKTFITVDGGEDTMEDNYWKAVFDLSDLPTPQRSGRFWKFSAMSRSTDAAFTSMQVQSSTYLPGPTSFEFYDLTGKLISICKHNKIDTVDQYPNSYLSSLTNRIDAIQASNGAAQHVSGANGLATVGGTASDTVTLAGGNVFLGFEVRRGASGNTAGGTSVNWNTDSPVCAADVGRTLRIFTGPNAGLYRIATVSGSNAVTVTTNGGAAVTFAADAGPTAWAIHDRIGTGHYLAIGGKESYVLSISDDFKTLVVADHFLLTGSGVPWEVRWRVNCTPCDKWGNDQAGSTWHYWYVLDYSYFTTDAKGTIAFHPYNVGNMPARSDGGTTSGTANFTGSWFTPDDVGRLLIVTSGVDKGRYEIASYVSPTAITVKSLDTGEAISFGATMGSLSYKIQGEVRFRASRYVTVLRN